MTAYEYTKRLYKFLKEGHKITFKKLRKNRGHIYVNVTPPTEVTLDHRDEVISTLIHETLHHFYPEKSEKWILNMENTIMRRLTPRQIKNIIKRLAQVI